MAAGNTAGPAGAAGAAASGAFGLASTAFGAAGAAGAAAGGAAGGGAAGPPPFAFTEIVPLLAVECAGGLGGLIFCTAFLRGQGLCRRCRRKRGKTRHRNGAQQSCLNGHPWSPLRHWLISKPPILARRPRVTTERPMFG